MMPEAHPLIRQLLRFAMLPYCYSQVDWKHCPRSKLGVAADMLYSFFVLRNFPDNYGPCRLWERPRRDWPRYYGSNYNPYQRGRLRRRVHPFFLERAMANKEVADGLCVRMGIRVPKSVGVLEGGVPAGARLTEMFDLTNDRRLIMKPIEGHAGIGIAIAELSETGVTVKSGAKSTTAKKFVPSERYLVQEIVRQRPDISAIAAESLNTIRLLSILSPTDEFLVIGASMRFGVSGSVIDNWSAGGVAVGIDHKLGTLKKSGFDKVGRSFFAHPDSKVTFEGFAIDGWSDVLSFAERVHRSFPFFRMLGMDLGLAHDGIVLVEINNDADLVFQEQTSGPLFEDEKVWRAFRDYDLLYNSKQRELWAP